MILKLWVEHMVKEDKKVARQRFDEIMGVAKKTPLGKIIERQ